MPVMRLNRFPGGTFQLLLLCLLANLVAVARAETITNLHQLTQAVSDNERIAGSVDIVATVCAASRPEVGVLIVQDDSGVELLQMGDLGRPVSPGEVVRIQGESCLVRKREMGVQISASPLLDNDGLHGRTPKAAEIQLSAGNIPIRVEWFNFWRMFNLDVLAAGAGAPLSFIESSLLYHNSVAGPESNNLNQLLPGLEAQCFEGSWESVPDFNTLEPIKTTVATNFTTEVRSRDERTGIRFSGSLQVPTNGVYRFEMWSDDGSMLFLGNPNVPVVTVGHSEAPAPCLSRPANATNADERVWLTLEGRASFVAKIGRGVKFDLSAAPGNISVQVADAEGLDMGTLQHSRVRLRGVGRYALTLDREPVLGKIFVARGGDCVVLERGLRPVTQESPATSVAQVQSLPIEEARKALPVRIRGTVTHSMKASQEHWMSFQDDTRGIFVRMESITNATPSSGELWELEGHTGAGDFAPIIIADKVTRLGEGKMPTPVTPTWTDLLNGSRDVQWAELTGLATEVHSNALTLHLPEGRLDVELERFFEPELKAFLKSVVRVRGVLYAVWDAGTHEVRVGRVMMRNASVTVDVPAPADVFEAVVKTPRELLLFDAQASPFRPVKVTGQIVYADSSQYFLQAADGDGLRLLPAVKTDVRPGDMVEAVGYPDIGRTELVLRETVLRTRAASGIPGASSRTLPPPLKVTAPVVSGKDLHGKLVEIEGILLGLHAEQGKPVLEMQIGDHLYPARLARNEADLPTLRQGSRLALQGVFVRSGQSRGSNADVESFELLLNSLEDIKVLSSPSWWTLPRLVLLSGLLLVILAATVAWNAQLRRLVEHRTNQLQNEIRERERAERQRELEAERARIARDLHDDLGSSLTEISVLASTGQLPQSAETQQPGLFRAIGAKARSLISSLDGIVWAVDPEDNSLQSLADYLSGYVDEFLSSTNIECRFKVPVSFPDVRIEGRVRHDILLAVKESLNNIVRHADASEVEFRMSLEERELAIEISDNGKGIQETPDREGHGLKNLGSRLQDFGGSCVVQSSSGQGTTVRILLPLGEAVAQGLVSVDLDRA